MTPQLPTTDTSATVKTVSVADYIVERLAAEGIEHCFGVGAKRRSVALQIADVVI
jgi:indolepyruvate decarboxylase